ncbi:12447_t:CDS:2 [Entrophospora sp. SA101]|nr:15783_t:CDS:2 [Entrophospora sp. SA101]CAJ0636938.1 12447_t:CDS:2 [Entrophospora sp. SA101]CAJ0831545.1 12877_t:CDS:2 [Entrophospora sp. SA101]CAJ0870240.1 16491_t:CDS:2 [Entrophospora sp. SA101]
MRDLQLPHIEFKLTSIKVGSYYEDVEEENNLCFIYKYLEETITIFFNENYPSLVIKLEDLFEFSKITSNTLLIMVKDDPSNVLTDPYSFVENPLYTKSACSTKEIWMIIDEKTPDEVVDMVGLHINYVISSRTPDVESNISEYQEMTAASIKCKKEPKRIKEKKYFFTCHVNKEIHDLGFPPSVIFEDLRKYIQKSFKLTEVKKLKYKDDDGDFITISDNDDFMIAMQIYSINNRLEIWV